MHSEQKKGVVVIAGPTGSGKNTILARILEEIPGSVRLVTATTRPPRPGEAHEKDYFFFTQEEFDTARARGDILEVRHIETTNADYGIFKPFLERALSSGLLVLAQVDIGGAKYLKEHFGAETFFVTVSDETEYERRVRDRHPGTPESEIQARLAIAKKELNEHRPWYDHTVYNERGHVEDAVRNILAILREKGYIH